MLLVTLILTILGGSLGFLPISRVNAAASPSVDGSAVAFCGHDTNSCSVSLSTSNSNDVIIVYTFEQLDLQTSCTFSVSDTAGLAWTFRAGASSRNDGTTGGDRDQMAEFWAVSANALSNDAVTESISGCASYQYGGEYNGLIAYGASGANTATPFDPNVSFPAATSGLGSPSVTVSTTNTKDLLIAGGQDGAFTNPPGALTAGPGFTLVASMNGGNEAAESRQLNSASSGITVSFGSNPGYWQIIADAINARGGAPPTADFAISANPSSLTLLVGSSGSSILTLSSVSGFSGSIKLTSTASQAGLGVTLSPSSVRLTSGKSATSQLSISTSNSTAPGSYVVTITGKSGSLLHSTTVAANVVTKISTPPSLDGTSNSFCGHDTNSCSTLLTTQNQNDLIVVYTVEDLDLQNSCTFSVSDSAGLAWSFRAQATGRNSGTPGIDRDQLAEFWAVSTNPLINDTITESILGCAGVYGGEYNGLMVFGIAGANINSPFDPNVSLPATSSDNFGTTASVNVSTNNGADMIIAAVLHGGAGTIPTAGPGFTIITSNGAGANAAEYETVTTPQSNVTVSFGDPVADYWEMIGDAVQSA